MIELSERETIQIGEIEKLKSASINLEIHFVGFGGFTFIINFK